MFGFGVWELTLLALLVGFLFGFRNLPQMAREMGRLHSMIQRIKDEIRSLFRFF